LQKEKTLKRIKPKNDANKWSKDDWQFNIGMSKAYPKSRPRRSYFRSKRGQNFRKIWIGGQKGDKNLKRNPVTLDFQ